ncbi:SDR family oxidoreductase [Roseateles sp.]|uniref:SDR family oxidoreductase n=1 Tax=Roseateles sp. TaxID=1971397 RepID=UPI002F3FD96E
MTTVQTQARTQDQARESSPASILVTGASGTIGSLVVQGLARRGASVKALVRKAGKAQLPAGVAEVVADLSDIPSMRRALSGVRTLFLLNAVTPDEVTQGLQTLSLAREAGIERIVYLSVIHADQFTDVPHFTGKHTVERMIDKLDLPVTVLRPAYFMQNDLQVQSVIESYGVYPMPIGAAGVAMIDTRDLADVAVAELLRRDAAPGPLPREVFDVVGPEALSGVSAAETWSRVLQREIRYGGDDLAAFEAQLAQAMPSWMAYDMRLMMARIQQQGMKPAAGTAQRLETLLGRPLRRYEALVKELVDEAR